MVMSLSSCFRSIAPATKSGFGRGYYFFLIRAGGFNFSTQKGLKLNPIWNAWVPTTPIARSRRDLRNVPENQGLKLPKSAIGVARTAPNRWATPGHVYAFPSRPVSRVGAGSSARRLRVLRETTSLDLDDIYKMSQKT